MGIFGECMGNPTQRRGSDFWFSELNYARFRQNRMISRGDVMNSSTVAVIGGGVIGLSTAYQLALKRVGCVVLLEKGRLGDGASSRAAGIGTHLMWSETGVRARQIGFQLFRRFSAEWDDYTFHDEHGCLNLFTPQAWPAREPLLPLYDRLQIPYEVLDAREIRSR